MDDGNDRNPWSAKRKQGRSTAARAYRVKPIPMPPLPMKRKRRKTDPLRLALLLFTVLVIAGCGTLSVGYFLYNSYVHKPLASFIRPVSRESGEPAQAASPVYDTIKGRSWNILLLGSDNDGKFSFPAVLTQVMMVVHIDTYSNTVSMVSFPRDSWVSVPGESGMHKIDQAFFFGAESAHSFEGGIRRARLTIEKDYGIPIDRYAWVGLSGFAQAIDTLGGVDIDITHPIVDDVYPDDTGGSSDPNNPYAYTRLYLVPGPQHLNGEQALAYVRSRHSDLNGDIGRTQRQQQVLEALTHKLNLSGVVEHLPQLLKDLTGQVYTDLNEQEMLAFANFGRTLSRNAVQRTTLGPGTGDQDFGNLARVYDPGLGADQSVLLPHCDKIQPVINRIFDLGFFTQSCNVTGGLFQ